MLGWSGIASSLGWRGRFKRVQCAKAREKISKTINSAVKRKYASKIAEWASGQLKEEEVKQNPELRKYVEESLKSEKTIHYIVDNAKIK